MAADEDFTPNGSRGRTDDGGSFFSVQGDKTPQLSAGQSVTGQTRYVGQACPGGAAVPTATAPNQIAVVVRGVCFFTEKMANVDGKGYAAAIVVNREGSDACYSFGMDVDGQTPVFSVDRRTGFGFFDQESAYNDSACQTGTASHLPGVNIGDPGDTVTVEAFFDGWGYVHLYKNRGGKLQDLDQYAIAESMQEGKATGFGDLSVHEVATSAVDNKLAYFSYYSGGFRVTRIREDGAGRARLEEVGRFIDQGGSNFWGVDVFKGSDGQEYVAASDLDYGLYIFKYTGP